MGVRQLVTVHTPRLLTPLNQYLEDRKCMKGRNGTQERALSVTSGNFEAGPLETCKNQVVFLENLSLTLNSP